MPQDSHQLKFHFNPKLAAEWLWLQVHQHVALGREVLVLQERSAVAGHLVLLDLGDVPLEPRQVRVELLGNRPTLCRERTLRVDRSLGNVRGVCVMHFCRTEEAPIGSSHYVSIEKTAFDQLV